MQKKKRKKIYSSTQETILQFYIFPKTTTKRGTERGGGGGGGTVCYAEGLKLIEKSNSVCGDVGGRGVGSEGSERYRRHHGMFS